VLRLGSSGVAQGEESIFGSPRGSSQGWGRCRVRSELIEPRKKKPWNTKGAFVTAAPAARVRHLRRGTGRAAYERAWSSRQVHGARRANKALSFFSSFPGLDPCL
jgi:hypothetical protein